MATDADLLEACRAGEVEAFAALVDRYQHLVRAVSYSATGDWAASQDVAQETFLVAWADLARLREPDRVRSWLCGIARNIGAKAARRRRREVPLEEAPEAPAARTPEDAVLDRELDRLVSEALARVPTRYREALVLFYQCGQSTAEVAAALGLSEAAVHQRLSRGRRYLKAGVNALVDRSLSRQRPPAGLVAAVIAAVSAPLAAPARAAGLGAAAKGALTVTTTHKLGALIGIAALIAIGALLLPSPTSSSPPEATVDAPAVGESEPSGEGWTLPRPKPARAVAPPALAAKPAGAPSSGEGRRKDGGESAWFGTYAMSGVVENWADGTLGHLLGECFSDYEGKAALSVTFMIDTDGSRVRGVRATGGDALGPSTDAIEGCVAKKLGELALEIEPGALPELEVTYEESKKIPSFDREAFEALDLSGAPTRGAPDARVNMIVFTGLRCVYCGLLLGTLDQLLDEYGDALRVTVRPIALGDDDYPVTEAAYAALAQGKFWAMHDQMFADQDRLRPESLRTFAVAAGLDMARYDADMAHRTFREQVELERAEIMAVGLRGLPMTVIDGERIVGAQPIDVFRARIDEVLRAP